jgi:hypothetical protein
MLILEYISIWRRWTYKFTRFVRRHSSDGMVPVSDTLTRYLKSWIHYDNDDNDDDDDDDVLINENDE